MTVIVATFVFQALWGLFWFREACIWRSICARHGLEDERWTKN